MFTIFLNVLKISHLLDKDGSLLLKNVVIGAVFGTRDMCYIKMMHKQIDNVKCLYKQNYNNI